MSIPLYFAVNWKDSVNNSNIRFAQCGFGFRADGSLRLPESLLAGAPAVIDDAILPRDAPEAAVYARLASLCKSGCLLDFERPYCRLHQTLIAELSQRLVRQTLFAVPERYCRGLTRPLPLVTQPRRCPNWETFLRETQARHPQGWMLELIPVDYSVKLPVAAVQSGFLSDAVCCYRQEGKQAHYFDTQNTVAQKLTAARRYGCKAAIGLYQELRKL